MCHLSTQDQYVCQSTHGIAEAVTGVLGSAQFPAGSIYHPRSSRCRFGHPREAAVGAGHFPDSNGISDLLPMAKARGIPPLGRTPNALPAPQAPAYLPMAKARGITQDLVTSSPWLKPGVSHPWGEHQMLCLLRRHLLTSPWLKPGASRRTW